MSAVPRYSTSLAETKFQDQESKIMLLTKENNRLRKQVDNEA